MRLYKSYPLFAMNRSLNSAPTLYEVLAERPPAGATSAETMITRQKETVDHDVETYACEALMGRD